MRMYIAADDFGDLVKLGLTREAVCSPPPTFVLPRVQPPRLPKFLKRINLDPKGRLCATFGSLTNIFCPNENS